jgi:hypothetical protein
MSSRNSPPASQATARLTSGNAKRASPRNVDPAALAATLASETNYETLKTQEDPSNHIKTLKDARIYLNQHKFLNIETPTTTLMLAHIALIISAAYSGKKFENEGPATMRALAVLLAEEDLSHTADIVASRVSDQVDVPLQAIRTASDNIETATGTMQQHAENLNNAVTKILEACTVMSTQATHTNELISRTDEITDNIHTLTQHLSSQPTRETTLPPPASQSDSLPTMSQITRGLDSTVWPTITPTSTPPRTSPPPGPVLAISNSADMDILFDISATGQEDIKNLTELEILERAHIAWDNIGEASLTKPSDKIFVSVTRLNHGGVRFRCTDAACANWARRQDIRSQFISVFLGGTCVLRDWKFSVIVEHVDISTNIDDTTNHRKWEQDNSLPEECITAARWLKRPERRTVGQTRAFLEILFSNRMSGNNVIARSFIIAGRPYSARKKLIEPEQCQKCGAFGHKALRCRAKNDVCLICTQTHKTRNCPRTDPVKCYNCAQDRNRLDHDHRATDRTCPVLQEACEQMKKTHPHNKFRYFPDVNEPWTWELNDAIPLPDPNNWYGRVPRQPPARTWLPSRTQERVFIPAPRREQPLQSVPLGHHSQRRQTPATPATRNADQTFRTARSRATSVASSTGGGSQRGRSRIRSTPSQPQSRPASQLRQTELGFARVPSRAPITRNPAASQVTPSSPNAAYDSNQ